MADAGLRDSSWGSAAATAAAAASGGNHEHNEAETLESTRKKNSLFPLFSGAVVELGMMGEIHSWTQVRLSTGVERSHIA